MNFIETRCHVCKRKVAVRYDDPIAEEAEVMQAAVDKWLPLVTCNPCYDAHDARQRTGETIFNACWALAHAKGGKPTGDMIQSARNAIEAALPKYANAVAYQMGSKTVLYNTDFIDCLVTRPDKCSDLLKQYRDEVRRIAREQRSEAA